MKEEVIKKIKEADISQIEWEYHILESITDKYAKGYLKAELGHILESLNYDSEHFRLEFINVCNWDIWGK